MLRDPRKKFSKKNRRNILAEKNPIKKSKKHFFPHFSYFSSFFRVFRVLRGFRPVFFLIFIFLHLKVQPTLTNTTTHPKAPTEKKKNQKK